MAELPLSGRRVVVTRAAAQAGELLQRLRSLGAEAISLPTIVILPPADPAPLAAALADLARFDGVIYSSANAVAAVAALQPPRPRGWVCAAGPTTAAAVREQLGWPVDIAAAEFGADGVVAALAQQPLAGCRILFPRAAAARDVIPSELARRGALLTSPEAYRTELPAAAADAVGRLLPGADAVLFTSPSTVRHLAELLPGSAPIHPALFAIGPATRAALDALGWRVAATAPEATGDGLISALLEYFHA